MQSLLCRVYERSKASARIQSYSFLRVPWEVELQPHRKKYPRLYYLHSHLSSALDSLSEHYRKPSFADFSAVAP